ncbi:MAG: HNH endonuclease family protein [Acidobacteria bacterium]|nr:HNH endonuclease family protein [Acidobacteriota bacterium]MCA1650227.1 HNH endonuclease family protein [Acidobacteriota bacterium]
MDKPPGRCLEPTGTDTSNAYVGLRSDRVSYILQRINETYSSAMTEQISIDVPLTVEHLMPQNWLEHWRLADGSRGVSEVDALSSSDEDPRATRSRARHQAVHTLGNLTVLVRPLNSSISNGAWSRKRPQLLAASLLPINLQLQRYDVWDEDAIMTRSREMFERLASRISAGEWSGLHSSGRFGPEHSSRRTRPLQHRTPRAWVAR